jgi:hypothetical protein
MSHFGLLCFLHIFIIDGSTMIKYIESGSCEMTEKRGGGGSTRCSIAQQNSATKG